MKKILSIILLLIIIVPATAQNKKKAKPDNICEPATFIHASIGGGIHNLCYDLG